MTERGVVCPASSAAALLETGLPAASLERALVLNVLRRSADGDPLAWPGELDVVASKSGGGATLDLDAENATASGPYGTPNLSNAFLEVMSLICSGVKPPFGARNSERVTVCVSGADIETKEMVEADGICMEWSWGRKAFKSVELEPVRLCPFPLFVEATERDEALRVWSGVTALLWIETGGCRDEPPKGLKRKLNLDRRSPGVASLVEASDAGG